MDLIPSVSRSSGFEDGGDALKEANVQRDYRTFIESKLERYWSKYPAASHLTEKSSDSQRNLQSNMLILFRKLREGLVASKRVDDFALEVYETSLYLSVLFRTPTQTTAIVNQLIPHGRGIYDAHTELSASHEARRLPGSLPNKLTTLPLQESTPFKTSSRRERERYRPPHLRREHASPASRARSPLHSGRQKLQLRSNIMSTTLISVFHVLVHSYPLQSSYHSTLTYFQQSQFFQEDNTINEIFNWLKSIAAAVASRNYVQFERLSRSHEVDKVCHRLGSLGSRGIDSHLKVRCLAVRCLVEDLRTKVRGTVWDVLMVAYRELDTQESADWLLQSLMISPDLVAGNPQASSSVCQFADNWLEQRGETEARRKEGSQGRWIMCRRRV